jgi:parallel beta-helix repeat protein
MVNNGIFFFEWSNNNVIVGNTISNHNYGVYIDFLSSNNRLYHNNFIDNVNQAYDNRSDNYWDDGYPSGGNYWSDFDESSEGAYDDYQGVDQNVLGSDDIVDNGTIAGGGKNPYVIDADSQDNYPLIDPVERLIPILHPPTLYINISANGRDVILYWDPPPVQIFDPYLIYRSTDPNNFDFSTPWVNTLTDKEPGELIPIPDRTMWNDTNAAFPSNVTNYNEHYYYVIKAFNVLGQVSSTSRTVGKWTKTFPQGVSTFSLPLEPLENITIDNCLNDMNATYIKWMNQTTHTWMKHGDGGVNDTQMKRGEGYEVKFSSQTNYTFTGMPGAMISYDDDTGFLGFDPATEAKNLTVSVEPNGNVTLTWDEPASMNSGDWYEVYYSTTRDGFFGNFNMSYFLVCPPVYFGNNTTTHIGASANDPGTRLYYMVVPFNAIGVRGAGTYSIGIWTEEFLSQYDTIGIPLKLSADHTADWYCDNIPSTIGINYYIYSEQRWGWHSTRMPAGAYDPMLVMAEGYQISISGATKFTFIGR